MSIIIDNIDVRLGARIRAERSARGWSLTELAQHSGVSRAMINRIERGLASPTAALLGRLAGAFGLSMSALLARAEQAGAGRLLRAAEQAQWRDPASGYLRRQIAPAPGSNLPLDLVRVELPAGAEVTFPSAAYASFRHLIWVLSGELHFSEGQQVHRLAADDCLELGEPSRCTYANRGRRRCCYVVIVLKPPA